MGVSVLPHWGEKQMSLSCDRFNQTPENLDEVVEMINKSNAEEIMHHCLLVNDYLQTVKKSLLADGEKRGLSPASRREISRFYQLMTPEVATICAYALRGILRPLLRSDRCGNFSQLASTRTSGTNI